MKKLFCLVVLFVILLPITISAQTFQHPEKEFAVEIFFKDKLWAVMTEEQFKAMLYSLELMHHLDDAEKNGRIIISMFESPIGKKKGDQFTTKVNILWITADNLVLKKLTLMSSFEVKGDICEEYNLTTYEKTAKIGFPVASGISVILLLLLLL